jgi:hypothetical protein
LTHIIRKVKNSRDISHDIKGIKPILDCGSSLSLGVAPGILCRFRVLDNELSSIISFLSIERILRFKNI